MFNQNMIATLMLALACLTGAVAEAKEQKRILIFSADIGMGHESAARAIKAGILAEDPTAVIEIVNVRQFSGSRVQKWVNEQAYQLMVKYKPEFWDALYNRSMERARTAKSISEVSKPYNETAVMNFIDKFKPDMIVNTFNLGVETLISLREQKLLSKDIKIAWIHTDYVTERYHMLLSRDIDMTFVAHPAMERAWVEKGISQDKVMTTGMPVNPQAYIRMSEAEKAQFLASEGLDPAKKTVVIMSGKEGIGNFGEIVKGLVDSFSSEQIQIVAICGKSTRNISRLQAMQKTLPGNIQLKIEGFIPNERVLGFVRSASAYITKSGGLSPTEAFVAGIPLVLLDINGGQERYNSAFYKAQKLAAVVPNESLAGAEVRALLDSPQAQAEMLAAQAELRKSINLDAITDYVIKTVSAPRPARTYRPITARPNEPVPMGRPINLRRAMESGGAVGRCSTIFN